MESQDQGIGQGNGQVAATKLYRRRRHSTRSNSLMKKKILYITGASLLISFLLVGVLLLAYTWDRHLIVKGVTISGINVSNLTQVQAKAAMDVEINRLLSQTVKLTVGQKSSEVKLEDLGLSVTVDSAIQDAYDISRKGSIYNRVVTKMAAAKGINFNLSQQWNDQKLKESLNKNLEGFNNPAIDASFEVSSQNTMNIKSEQIGQVFDAEALTSQIKEINIYKPVQEIKVGYKDQLPNVTAAQLEDQKITGLLASYTTRFDPTQSERTQNLRVATKALDKTIVKPGDTFSFNEIVGERTVESGYKDAYIIVDGKFIPGLGGGICQVSSTLYNVGLLANLSVTQRSNHDLAISYVPLGQDATVAYPDLDLKFNNNSGGYLLIRTMMSANTITIELYGKVKPGQEVNITDTTESIIPAEEQRISDPTLAHGVTSIRQEGKPGCIVKSVRTVKMNGQVVSSEPLKESRYLAVPKIVAVGP